MSTVSICTIVKNENKYIRDFLDSILDFADEIVIVDNNSTDNTKEIIESYGLSVYESNAKFDLARNVYLEKAKCEWILVLDVDERISKEDYIGLKASLDSISEPFMCGLVASNNYYGLGQWSTWFVPRIIRNNHKIFISTEIHGSVIKSVEKNKGLLFWSGITLHHLDALIHLDQSKKRLRNISLITKQLNSSEPDNDLYVNLACEFFASEKPELALKTIKTACELLNNNSAKAYRYYGNIAYYCGLYDESIAAMNIQIEKYKKSIELKEVRWPRSSLEIDLCNVTKVKCLYKKGKIEEAIKLCEENIKRNPSLSHNYINEYILSGYANLSYLDLASKYNSMLKDFKIYSDESRQNLYKLSSVIIESNWNIK